MNKLRPRNDLAASYGRLQREKPYVLSYGSLRSAADSMLDARWITAAAASTPSKFLATQLKSKYPLKTVWLGSNPTQLPATHPFYVNLKFADAQAATQFIQAYYQQSPKISPNGQTVQLTPEEATALLNELGMPDASQALQVEYQKNTLYSPRFFSTQKPKTSKAELIEILMRVVKVKPSFFTQELINFLGALPSDNASSSLLVAELQEFTKKFTREYPAEKDALHLINLIMMPEITPSELLYQIALLGNPNINVPPSSA